MAAAVMILRVKVAYCLKKRCKFWFLFMTDNNFGYRLRRKMSPFCITT